MKSSDTYFIARYAETDQMGIVHHSNYPIWFEAGRTDFIKTAMISYSEIEKKGYMLPLIELNCNYISASKYEDEIRVNTSVKDFTKTRITFYYEVFANNSEKPVATGETVHVWTDTSLKPVNLAKAAPEIYEIICQCASN